MCGCFSCEIVFASRSNRAREFRRRQSDDRVGGLKGPRLDLVIDESLKLRGVPHELYEPTGS